MKVLKKYWVIVVGAILILLFVGTCNMHRILPQRDVKIETIVVHDTTYLKQDTAWLDKYRPIIDRIIAADTVAIIARLDSVSQLKYSELVNAYLKEVLKNQETTVYNESFKIYDKGTKTNIATFNLTDSVTGNRIKSRQPFYTIDSLPIIRTTTTITKTEIEPVKKRNQVFLGTEIGGQKDRIFNSVEVGGIFKTKADRLYKLGYQWNSIGPAQVKAGVYIKL